MTTVETVDKRPRRKILFESFRDAVVTHFKPELLFALFTGSYAYGKVTTDSDIDVLVVLRDGAKSCDLTRRRREFTKIYTELHVRFGYKPDNFFPGEVISEGMLVDALHGRGFDVKDENICLENISENQDWLKDGREYRCWHSMMAFNNSQFIAGDKISFFRRRRQAMHTIAKFLLYENPHIVASTRYEFANQLANIVLDKGSGYLGITRQFYSPQFENDFSPLVEDTLRDLQKEGYVSQDTQIKANSPKVLGFSRVIAININEKNFKSRPLFNWEEIRCT